MTHSQDTRPVKTPGGLPTIEIDRQDRLVPRAIARYVAAVLFMAATLGILVPSPARAQGALVYGTVSAAATEDRTSPAYGGGVAYRFNRVLGLGVELSHIRASTPDTYYRFCCDDGRGRTTLFTTNVRLEIPTTARRVIPFVVGGGGAAAVTRSYPVYYALLADLNLPILNQSIDILPGPPTVETTTVNMVLTLGGGASLLFGDHISVDADLRVVHLMGDAKSNIGRFGVGLGYRF